ncbi:hypothetical protein BDAP_001427 [Binucleata daphniae]
MKIDNEVSCKKTNNKTDLNRFNTQFELVKQNELPECKSTDTNVTNTDDRTESNRSIFTPIVTVNDYSECTNNKYKIDMKAKLLENKKSQKELHRRIKKINKVLNRLKIVSKYIKQKYVPYYQQKNYQSLFSVHNQKEKSTKLHFNMIEKDFFDSKPDLVADLYDYNDPFWFNLASKVGLSAYTCYNLWINNCKNDEVTQMFLSKSKTNYDWIELAKMYKVSPIKLFITYKQNKKTRNKWTAEEDDKLNKAIIEHGYGKWIKIAKNVDTKNAKQCLHRYKNKFRPDINKGRWSKDEDKRLREGAIMYNAKHWNKISEYVGTRNDSQCRERYVNVIDPTIKKDKWTIIEDEKLLSLVVQHGNKNWVKISQLLQGRTDAMCRRRYLQLKKIQLNKNTL